MNAIHYLRGRMDGWLTSAGATDPIEFACSRHELHGAARALQEAGLLTAEDARTLLDEYDTRLGEAGHLQRAAAFMGSSTSVRGGGEGLPSARSRDHGRLERMITVPQPSDATPVGDPLVGLLLEVWTDMVAFHYRDERVPSRHHGRGGPRWEALDDRDGVYHHWGREASARELAPVVSSSSRDSCRRRRRGSWCVPPTQTGRPRAWSSTCDLTATTSRGGEATPAGVRGRRTRPSDAQVDLLATPVDERQPAAAVTSRRARATWSARQVPGPSTCEWLRSWHGRQTAC
jgi:hypothetical protein